MKLVSTEQKCYDPKNPDVICVGLAIDSNIYYAALVDIRTRKNYVVEVGVSQAQTMFTSVTKEIEDNEEWGRVSEFFNKAGVFESFYKGTNWCWTKRNNEQIIPEWFKQRYCNKS